MKGEKIRTHQFMSRLLDQCADEIELLFEEETGGSPYRRENQATYR
jgi:hypothetical protein